MFYKHCRLLKCVLYVYNVFITNPSSIIQKSYKQHLPIQYHKYLFYEKFILSSAHSTRVRFYNMILILHSTCQSSTKGCARSLVNKYIEISCISMMYWKLKRYTALRNTTSGIHDATSNISTQICDWILDKNIYILS